MISKNEQLNDSENQTDIKEEMPETPIPYDSVTLKKGVLTMLGDASRESVSSVYEFLAAELCKQIESTDQESLLDFIYDELDSLDKSRLSELYKILSKFE